MSKSPRHANPSRKPKPINYGPLATPTPPSHRPPQPRDIIFAHHGPVASKRPEHRREVPRQNICTTRMAALIHSFPLVLSFIYPPATAVEPARLFAWECL